MAIDKLIFIEHVKELEGFYNRTFTEFVRRAWFKHLNAQLSTDQFVSAVESAVISKQFMPTADELVAIVCGSSESQALSDWELCVTAASRADRAMLSEMSSQGHTALQLIGGLHKLGMQTQDQLIWTKKQFLEVWKSTPAGTRSLPQSNMSDNGQLDAVREMAEKMSLNGHNP